MRMSSISATRADVYVACPATQGYGFDVWRTDPQFDNAKKVVTELRGCCGQMDVHANEDGVYVAENGRFRVARFNRDGELVGQWGQREDRTGSRRLRQLLQSRERGVRARRRGLHVRIDRGTDQTVQHQRRTARA